MYACLSDSPFQSKMAYTTGNGGKLPCHADKVGSDKNAFADQVRGTCRT